MEPNKEMPSVEATDTELARSRFLDSMGLGEASLQDLAPTPPRGDFEEGVALSSQSEEMEIPGVPVQNSASSRVVGVQIGSPESSPETGELPSVASLEGDTAAEPEASGEGVEEAVEDTAAEPEASGESVEEAVEDAAAEQESLQLHCPKCNGELALRREHIGIEGSCVWCETKIVAAKSSEDGSVRVFAVFQPGEEENSPVAEASAIEESGETGDDFSGVAELPEASTETPAPVDAAPVEAAPVDAAPVDAAPVDAAPVDAAPVDAAPVVEETTVEEKATELPEFGAIGDLPTHFEPASSGFGDSLLPAFTPSPIDTPSPIEDGVPSAPETGGFSPVPDFESTSGTDEKPESKPFPEALEPLTSGFSDAAESGASGFGDFLASSPEADKNWEAEAGSKPADAAPATPASTGFADPSAWSGTADLPPSPPAAEASSIPDGFSGIADEGGAGNEGSQPPEAAPDSWGQEAAPGKQAPPPLEDPPSNFPPLENSGTEEDEAPLPVPEMDAFEAPSAAESGFTNEANSGEQGFGFDQLQNTPPPLEPGGEAADPIAKLGNTPAAEGEEISWGDSPPIGAADIPATESAEEPLSGFEGFSAAEETDAPGNGSSNISLFSESILPAEEDSTPLVPDSAEPAAGPAPEVADEPAAGEVVEGNPLTQAISLPDSPTSGTEVAPNVSAQSLGTKPRRGPRKGLIIFLVLLIGLVCGAALASFMLPVEEYVLKGRELMEAKFGSSPAFGNSLVAPEVTTQAPDSAPTDS